MPVIDRSSYSRVEVIEMLARLAAAGSITSIESDGDGTGFFVFCYDQSLRIPLHLVDEVELRYRRLMDRYESLVSDRSALYGSLGIAYRDIDRIIGAVFCSDFALVTGGSNG